MKKEAGEVKAEASKVRLDLTFWILMAGLIALPVAALMLHIKLHSDYIWLTWIVLFDAVIISLLFFFRKTIFYGFMLNTTLFITGVIAHLTVAGGISDVLLAVPDFAIGYALWRLYK